MISLAENVSSFYLRVCIIQLFGHCTAEWYAMSQSLVKVTEIETSWGRGYSAT